MISLRNPARTRQDNTRLARGLSGSAAIHVALFLLWFSAAPTRPTPKLDALRTYPTDVLEMTEVQIMDAPPAFSDVPGPPQAAAGGAASEGGPAGEEPPSENPVPERVTPPATARVRAPRPDVTREGRPTPARVPDTPPARRSEAPTRGRSQPAPRPTGANRPVAQQGTGTEAGTGQGVGTGAGRGNGGGDGSGAGAGTGSGSDGTGTREVGFALGNRTYDCPTPSFEGIPGSVTLTVTFSPTGAFVAASGRGNADLLRSAKGAARSCRAQPLPRNASQTNQTTTATFRFVAG